MKREWRGVPLWVWLLLGLGGVWAGTRYLEHRNGSNPLTLPVLSRIREGSGGAAPGSVSEAGPQAVIPPALYVQYPGPNSVYVPGVGQFDTANLTPGQSQALYAAQVRATGY